MSAIAVTARGREQAAVLRACGAAALAACVCASWWIAVGAAGDRYLLRLPTGANPPWIHGPLQGLGASLSPSALSVALIALAIAYSVALACAGSIPLRVVLASVVLANLAFTLAPSIVSTDVFGYIAYAREGAAYGLNPYVSPPAAIPHDAILPLVFWTQQTSPYGPLFTALSLPLGLTSPAFAFWFYKAAAGGASIALAWLAATVARDRAVSPARAVVFVGLNPVLLFYAVSGAHNDLFAALLLTAALALVASGRDAAATAASVAAFAIKVTFGLAVPFMVIGAGCRRAAARAAALALIAGGIATVVLFGTHVFDQVHRISSERIFDIAFSGADRLARLLGTHIDTAIRVACTGGAALVALAMIAWAWRRREWITAAGWAFLAVIASIGSLAPWYLVWILPLAAVSQSRSLRAATLLATTYLIAVHLPALGGEPWLTAA